MKWVLLISGILALLVAVYASYTIFVANPRVIEELRTDPQGEHAATAMLLTFPDGRILPVNYLWEGDRVYVGADGPWWREFQGDGAPVSLLIRGRRLTGHATVQLEDDAFRAEIFSRLRPAASWLPGWLDAKLVVIELDQTAG